MTTPHQRAGEIFTQCEYAADCHRDNATEAAECVIQVIAAALNDEIEACLQTVIKVSDDLAYKNMWKERVGANRAIEALQQRKGAR